MENCIKLVSCITPLPNLDTILQHLAMFCGALNNCSSVLHSESMQVVWPCWKDVAREGFGRTRVLSPYQVSCIEKLGQSSSFYHFRVTSDIANWVALGKLSHNPAYTLCKDVRYTMMDDSVFLLPAASS
ncbi:uncharacterized protein LOC142786678 [Rhipicephalus microplus]|uniref:uncharacterized protein LOC142786678 n=1 Tax=Rhipicephalus microplus TaxID=6941 RepID=UPI003F6D4856